MIGFTRENLNIRRWSRVEMGAVPGDRIGGYKRFWMKGRVLQAENLGNEGPEATQPTGDQDPVFKPELTFGLANL
jgi:hypothetical protein